MGDVCHCQSKWEYVYKLFLPLVLAFFLVLTTGTLNWLVVVLVLIPSEAIMRMVKPEYAKYVSWTFPIVMVSFGLWFYFLNTIVIWPWPM